MGIFSRKIVGIDLHDYSAELVEISQKGKEKHMEAYNRVLIPIEVLKNGEIRKPEELKKILKSLLETANPLPVKTKDVSIIYPPNKVLTHVFTFPANLKEKEIKKSIEYEAETVIPFSISDVYWDFMIIDSEDKSKEHASQYVFFACINKKIADDYTAVLEDIGLNPVLSGINAETLHYAMWKQIQELETCLIIDVEALSVNYLIVENKKIKHYFSSNEGGRKLLKNVQSPESIIFAKKGEKDFSHISNLEDITKLIGTNYKRANAIIGEIQEKEKNLKIKTIILTGEFLNMPNFYELATKHFPDKKIYIGEPKENLIINQKKFLPKEKLSKAATPYSTHFANAVGIALRSTNGHGEAGGINLLPIRLKESITNKRKMLILTIIVLVITGISLFLATYMFFKHQSLYFERLQLEIEKSAIEQTIYGTRYQEIRDEITGLNIEITELSKIDKTLFSVPVTFDEVYKLVPEGVEIKSIKFIDEYLEISMTGIANSREQILKLQKNLEEAEFIDEVIAPISNFDEKEEISFLIQIKLNFIKLAKYDSSPNAK
jgi:type IV pilus assembly protein PilM